MVSPSCDALLALADPLDHGFALLPLVPVVHVFCLRRFVVALAVPWVHLWSGRLALALEVAPGGLPRADLVWTVVVAALNLRFPRRVPT